MIEHDNRLDGERLARFLADNRIWALCAIIALAQGILFVGSQAALTGRLAFPLDDAYIHSQYGAQIARGDYFRYQPGDPVSSGATSFLYAHILAPGRFIGLHGDGMLLWAIAIAWICVTILLRETFELGRILAGDWPGWTAAAAVAASGWIAWGFWSGMEIALFAALIAAFARRVLESQRIGAGAFLLAALLGLCRPEGALMVLVFLSTVLGLRAFGRTSPWFPGGWRESAGFIAAAAAAFVPTVFYRLATGSFASNGLLAKSVLHNPVASMSEKLGEIASNALGVFAFLNGALTPPVSAGEFVPPGLLLFAAVGLIAHSIGGAERRILAVRLGIPLAAVIVSFAALEVWPLHSYRYLLPFAPILFAFAIRGLIWPFQWFARDRAVPVRSLCGIALAIQVTFVPLWAGRYAEQCQTIVRKQTALAEWLNRNRPAGEPLFINDAGVLAYYGDANIHDLVGLVTNGNAIPYRMGEGAMYELLSDIPEPDRPTFAALFPSWFQETARTFGIFHDPAVVFPDPFDSGFSKYLYRIQWEYADMGLRPRDWTMRPGWEIRGRLDVANLESESEHRYSIENRDGEFPPNPVPLRRNFGYHNEIEAIWPGVKDARRHLIPLLGEQGLLNQYDIVDAGRRIDGAESFTFSNLVSGRPLHLVLRTCDDLGEGDSFVYRMRVYADGAPVGEWTIQGAPWNWIESVFEIPGEFVRGESVRIRVENLNRREPVHNHHVSYYYWACQAP